VRARIHGRPRKGLAQCQAPEQWRTTLVRYASPAFGKLPVAAIDETLVLRALKPIWHDKPETASRVRGRIESILDWARVHGYASDLGAYRITVESLISLASRAVELFERSKAEQKRELIAFVFSNLRLRGKKLEFSLRSPFDLMVNRQDYSGWLAFLNTVRTERFQEVLSLRGLLPSAAA
jgi:hypothetical protein